MIYWKFILLLYPREFISSLSPYNVRETSHIIFKSNNRKQFLDFRHRLDRNQHLFLMKLSP